MFFILSKTLGVFTVPSNVLIAIDVDRACPAAHPLCARRRGAC